MKHGYRVRHRGWIPGCFLYIEGFTTKLNYVQTYGGGIYHSFQENWQPTLIELVSDDWELILEGITNDFGYVKYGETK